MEASDGRGFVEIVDKGIRVVLVSSKGSQEGAVEIAVPSDPIRTARDALELARAAVKRPHRHEERLATLALLVQEKLETDPHGGHLLSSAVT